MKGLAKASAAAFLYVKQRFHLILFINPNQNLIPMKLSHLIPLLFVFVVAACSEPQKRTESYYDGSRVEKGRPVSVMMTAYSTTLLADDRDEARLRIALLDSINREITTAEGLVRLYVEGDASLRLKDGSLIDLLTDKKGERYAECVLTKGICERILVAGTTPGKVQVEARMEGLWPGGHEIHIIPADIVQMKPTPDQLPATTKPIGRMIGADISWLPEMEAEGRKFYDQGVEKNGIDLLKDLGFNTIRLRIFVNPENEEGYSPGKGYCGFTETLEMAKHVKEAGMELLLDYHYSDYWADPQKQFKPKAWEGLDFDALQDTVRAYTSRVMQALHDQGTPPDMVQVGNEINHGMIWPEGHISNPDQLAALLRAGTEGVEAVDAEVPVMMHVALGGQNKEAIFWFDNMIARGVRFDIIGLSYYPRWHGTLEDLGFNLNNLLERYNKPLNVVEYSDFKQQVHDIVFNLPNDMGKGSAIWEPLRWGDVIVDEEGQVLEHMTVFKELSQKYLE